MKDKPKVKSEKVLINRLLNSKLPTDEKTALDLLRRVSAKSRVPLEFLTANALQEGLVDAVRRQRGDDWYETDYPVNGYEYYGLDTFGSAAPRLKSKGYIPKDMDYNQYSETNEKGESVTPAAFKSNEDALTAKAAYLKDFRDSVREYSSKKGLKMEPKTEQYLTMAAYNGGMGNARKMIDELSGGKVSQKDYIEKGLTSRKGVHKNIAPRMEKMNWILQMATGPAPAPKQPFPSLFDYR